MMAAAQNGYDHMRAQYQAIPLTINEAHRRSQLLPLNWSGIDTSSLTVSLPTPAPHVHIHYPAYLLGYQPGARTVRLPSHLADPDPVANQYAHMSSHTYYMFTEADLPSLLFQLEPMLDPYSNVCVPDLYDLDTGLPVINNEGWGLRYFSFLPRFVEHDVSGALLEFWFRLDSRLEMNDIRDRMVRSSTGAIPNLNALGMKRTRWRQNTSMLAWYGCRTWPGRGDLERVGNLSMLQICFNTTMIVDWQNRRLLKPVYTDHLCNEISHHVVAGIGLDAFLLNIMTTIPTRRMFAILALRWRLQELAFSMDRGTEANAYLSLDNADEPIWWNDRGEGGNPNDATSYENVFAEEQDNCTHGEYMRTEVGNNLRLGRPRRQRNRRRRYN